MSRLDKYGIKSEEGRDIDNEPVEIKGIKNQARINTSQHEESKIERPISNRYQTQDGQRTVNSLEDGFNDDEDFKLSTDHQQSIQGLHAARSRKASQDGMLSVQNIQHSSQPALQQQTSMGEGLRADEMGSVDFTNRDQNQSMLQESRQKIRESVQYQEEKIMRLESS